MSSWKCLVSSMESKVVFFFFPGKSLFFYTFGRNSSVCVKTLLFFPAAGKKTEFSYECVCPRKLCQEKKKRTCEKKYRFFFCVKKCWCVESVYESQNTISCQSFCKSKQKADTVPIKLNYQPWNCGSRLIRG